MKLLLIEDDERVAQVLAEAFRADGHETTVRHTGEDGLDYLTRERPERGPGLSHTRAPGRGRARRPVASLEWRRRPTKDQVDRSGATGDHHDGSRDGRRNRRSASSRSHRDHREARGPEALQRSARTRPESRSTSGPDVEPVTAILAGSDHRVDSLTQHVIGPGRGLRVAGATCAPGDRPKERRQPPEDRR